MVTRWTSGNIRWAIRSTLKALSNTAINLRLCIREHFVVGKDRLSNVLEDFFTENFLQPAAEVLRKKVPPSLGS